MAESIHDEMIPLEIAETTRHDAFSVSEWLEHLGDQAFPANPPASPRSPFVPRTFRQLANLFKVSTSLGLSLLIRKPVTWGTPLTAMIEPTSLCNLKCPLCPSGNGSLTRERTRLDFDVFREMFDKIPESVRMLVLWNQGEPFLVKDLPRMIRYAKRRDLYVVTSTNGHYFRTEKAADEVIASGLDELIVSLDGADQEVYETYRVGGKLQWVYEGVQRIVEAKNRRGSRTPLVHLQFILMRQNLHQREDMIELGRRLGADRLSFKTLQITGFDGGESFLPDDPGLTRYERKNGNRYITQKRRFFPDDCLRLWYDVVVNCDGVVAPCCFDKDADFPMGNLMEHTFDEIWRGAAYQRFRQHLLDSRYDHAMCQDCTEGVKKLFTFTVDYHRS